MNIALLERRVPRRSRMTTLSTSAIMLAGIVLSALLFPVTAHADGAGSKQGHCPTGYIEVHDHTTHPTQLKWHFYDKCVPIGVGGASGFPGPVDGSTLTGGGGSPKTTGNTQAAAKPQDQRNPCDGKVAAAAPVGTHPIELGNRSETLALTLFRLPGEMGLNYSLYYTSPRFGTTTSVIGWIPAA